MSMPDGSWRDRYSRNATPPKEETVTQHLPGSNIQNGLFIPGVVDQVERSKLLEFIASLGLDYKHLRGITIYHNEIVVEKYALKDGQVYFVPDPTDPSPDGGHVAVHRISIPVRP